MASVRTALLALASLLTLNPGVAWADCVDPFADPDDVLTFHLRLTEADWRSVRYDEPVGLGCDAQYPFAASATCSGNHARAENQHEIGVSITASHVDLTCRVRARRLA